MIHILDDIQLPGTHLPEVLHWLEHDYLPHCAARGVQLQQRWISPPVPVEGVPSHLWLLWQVADVASYYGMRARQDAGVVAFWQRVDRVCVQRARHVLGEPQLPPASTQAPTEVTHAA